MLDPIDYRDSDGKKKAPPVKETISSQSPHVEFDKLIISYNSQFHTHLKTGSSATHLKNLGEKYVLSRIIGRNEIDAYHKEGTSRLNFVDQIQDTMTEVKP